MSSAQPPGRFNLSALAVRERGITLFLILLASPGCWPSSNWGAKKTRPSPSSR